MEIIASARAVRVLIEPVRFVKTFPRNLEQIARTAAPKGKAAVAVFNIEEQTVETEFWNAAGNTFSGHDLRR